MDLTLITSAGHGRPPPAGTVALLRALTCLSLVLLALCFSADAAAEELQVRLRLAWGGGAARSWQGTIKVPGGTIADPIPLGLEADTPGSMELIDPTTLRIAPRSPRSYDGVDLLVTAPSDASLIVELAPTDGPAAPAIEWPLAKIARSFQQAELDDRKNRLVGQRSPGDRLPVTIHRQHLVFEPAEKLEFTVAPRPVDLAPLTSYVLNVALMHARGGGELASQDREFRTDGDSLPDLDGEFALTLPIEAGVYDVQIALFPKRLTLPLVRNKPLAERRLQLVVVDPGPPNADPSPEWETALELDPAQPRWWEKMTRLPSMAKIPGFRPQTYGNGTAFARSHLGRTLVEIAPDIWQAYPLSLGDVGRLHVLEVEYPDDVAQSLQISLVEPNAAGQVVPVGLDTGLETSPPPAGASGRMRIHRVPFWPQTKSPLVLLANRSPDLPALYGKIRVLVGPRHLPPLELAEAASSERMLAVALDRPFFCENFGAGEALDAPTGQVRKDWVAFHAGAERLAEYLAHTGRNAAILTFVGEGSALYPSPILQPTPQYDSGIYFESGQDPLRKDAAELLFRIFDRAGLVLIPAVKFSAPLPELELARQTPDAIGIEPVGPDGRTHVDRHGTRRGIGVHYNPLDPRVQSAMRRVVAEISERYGNHPSFGGVAVHLSPDSYALLPDATHSLDDATIARYSDETGVVIPGEGPDRYAQRAAFLQGKGSEAWLQWRASQLAGLYHAMEGDIARVHAGARLYLQTGELLASRTLQLPLRPVLPQSQAQATALLFAGIDCRKLAEQGMVVAPRPLRLAPSFLPDADLQVHWNQWSGMDEMFAGASYRAVLFAHEPAPLRLASFDAASPFGAGATHTWFIPPLVAGGDATRQRFVHSLAVNDVQVMIDAGWLLPLGHDEDMRKLAAVYRRLPARPFTAAPASNKEERTQPVTIRWLAGDGKTWFYAVNDSPWPVTLEVDFESGEIFRLTSYDPDRPGTLTRQASKSTWSVSLEPYDLVGGELSSAKARVDTWRVSLPREVEPLLREQLHDVRQRALSLRSPLPLDVLDNPSFEKPVMDGAIPGWTAASGEGVIVEVDAAQASRDNHSLHLASRAPPGKRAPAVWVRTQPFAPPATGRLSVLAWIKVVDPRQQPKLRMAIEGKLDGKSFYRRRNVGASEDGTPVTPLTTTWAAYLFPLTDLPTTGATELRIGFDLMGEGNVWIDDVQVYDIWFEDHERNELLKNIANADFQLSAGNVGDCQRFLDSYWPRFLRRHVPLADAANPLLSAEPPLPAVDQESETAEAPRRPRHGAKEKAEEKPGMLERMRSWWPKSLWR